MTLDDLQYIEDWAADGHYDNGDYGRIHDILQHLICAYKDQHVVYTLTPQGKATVEAMKGQIQ